MIWKFLLAVPLLALMALLIPEGWVLILYLSALPVFILGLLGTAGFLAYKQKWRLAGMYVITSISLAAYIYVATPAAVPYSITSNPPRPTIAFANVLSVNKEKDAAVDSLLATEALFIGVAEYDKAWKKHTTKLKAAYPYYYEHHAEGNLGIAYYSKYPAKLTKHIWGAVMMLEVYVELPEGPKNIWVVHALNPVLLTHSRIRNQQMAMVAQKIQKKSKTVECVFTGDLNCVSWDPAYKRFLEVSGLRNTSPYELTWAPPMLSPLSILPIDHAISTSDKHIGTTSFFVPGSDHKGLIMYY